MSAETSSQGKWKSAALWLGIATGVGHALSYGFSIVMSRALGPADYGALGALLGIAIVATVPATALQTQLARVAALGSDPNAVAKGLRLSWSIGAALALALAALSIPMMALLRLEGPSSVILLALGVLPVSVIAARQGVLLGRADFTRLGWTTVLIPGLRLISVAVPVWIVDLSLPVALGLQAAATWVGLLVVITLVKIESPGAADLSERTTALTLRGVYRAGSTLLALFVLANLDVFLARIFLPDAESGIYAVGALGAKVVFWGSHFVALLVFPRVARGERGRHVVRSAGLLITSVGVVLMLLAVPFAAPTITAIVGAEYSDAARVAPIFVVYGTVLALAQLISYVAVARDRHQFAVLIWATVLVQSLVVSTVAHGGVASIVVACAVCTGLLVLLSAIRLKARDS